VIAALSDAPGVPAGDRRSARHAARWAWHGIARRPVALAATLLSLSGTGLFMPSAPALAGIRFENCVQGSDGSISCDTVPTGNTYLDDKDAQYGLLQQASPGWSEFNPYQGYDEDFGGGED
jgi:hypothetical protein